MAKSHAKKKRDHLLRTVGRDVTISRGSAGDFSTHVRRTMSKAEKLKKLNTKHKKRQLQDQRLEESAFCHLKRLFSSVWLIFIFGRILKN